MRTVWQVLKGAKKYWWCFALALAGVAISTIAGFYTPWALRELTSLATEGSDNFAMEALRIGLLLLGATLVQAAGKAASGHLNHFGALHYVSDLRESVYQNLQQMSLRYFYKNRTGDLTGRIVNDVLAAEVLLAHVIPDYVVNILTFIGVGILLFAINWALALLSLIMIPFLFGVTLWQTKRMFPIWRENVKVRGELSGCVQDNLSGIKEIQIFNKQAHEAHRIADLSRKHSSFQLKASKHFETTYPLLAFLTTMGSVIVVIFGGQWIATGRASIADVVAFLMYLSMFYGPVQSFSQLTEMAGEATAGCRRVFEVLDEIPEIKEKPNAKMLPRVQGSLEFRDVTFSYSEKNNIIDAINLTIKPRQTVALVGTTGVGKSTIASLINRFYDPQEGSVLIDGTDIRNVTLSSLRDNISMVLQDTFLFNGTIYENIVYGLKNATREQVIDAAKAANAHTFIEVMENGYNTVVGERGVRLSGGQKQRISIARAILRNTPILILDEATSALDSKTEKEIQAALDKISVGRTTIVIAHRLSTIRHADQIVVLEGTGIAEIGTHDELIRCGGIYAKLHAAQAS